MDSGPRRLRAVPEWQSRDRRIFIWTCPRYLRRPVSGFGFASAVSFVELAQAAIVEAAEARDHVGAAALLARVEPGLLVGVELRGLGLLGGPLERVEHRRDAAVLAQQVALVQIALSIAASPLGLGRLQGVAGRPSGPAPRLSRRYSPRRQHPGAFVLLRLRRRRRARRGDDDHGQADCNVTHGCRSRLRGVVSVARGSLSAHDRQDRLLMPPTPIHDPYPAVRTLAF